MRLVTYTLGSSGARLGVVVNGLVVDVARLGASRGVAWPADMLSFIDNAVTLLPALKQCLDNANGSLPAGAAVPIEDVKQQAPIPRPRKNIFGIGLNYVEHVAESSRTLDTSRDLPAQPVIFSKPPTTVIGPGEPIRHNADITQVQQLAERVDISVRKLQMLFKDYVGATPKWVIRRNRLLDASDLLAKGSEVDLAALELGDVEASNGEGFGHFEADVAGADDDGGFGLVVVEVAL